MRIKNTIERYFLTKTMQVGPNQVGIVQVEDSKGNTGYYLAARFGVEGPISPSSLLGGDWRQNWKDLVVVSRDLLENNPQEGGIGDVLLISPPGAFMRAARGLEEEKWRVGLIRKEGDDSPVSVALFPKPGYQREGIRQIRGHREFVLAADGGLVIVPGERAEEIRPGQVKVKEMPVSSLRETRGGLIVPTKLRVSSDGDKSEIQVIVQHYLTNQYAVAQEARANLESIPVHRLTSEGVKAGMISPEQLQATIQAIYEVGVSPLEVSSEALFIPLVLKDVVGDLVLPKFGERWRFQVAGGHPDRWEAYLVGMSFSGNIPVPRSLKQMKVGAVKLRVRTTDWRLPGGFLIDPIDEEHKYTENLRGSFSLGSEVVPGKIEGVFDLTMRCSLSPSLPTIVPCVNPLTWSLEAEKSPLTIIASSLQQPLTRELVEQILFAATNNLAAETVTRVLNALLGSLREGPVSGVTFENDLEAAVLLEGARIVKELQWSNLMAGNPLDAALQLYPPQIKVERTPVLRIINPERRESNE